MAGICFFHSKKDRSLSGQSLGEVKGKVYRAGLV